MVKIMRKRSFQKKNKRRKINKRGKRTKAKREKRIWTEAEDKELLKLIKVYGPLKWSIIATFMNGRQGKQCRERWHNHLNPEISKLP